MIKVDRAKAAELGLTQDDVMQNVVAAFNSSIQFNKHNFWIDPKSKNQYFVGVQYSEKDIKSIETLLDIPITTKRPDVPKRPIPLRNVVSIELNTVADRGHALQHPADDRADDGRLRARPGPRLRRRRPGLEPVRHSSTEPGTWAPYDPDSKEKQTADRLEDRALSGEYLRMKDTFSSLAVGLILASLLIYFLMVGLDKSFVVPLSVMSIVPLCLIGILPMLYLTGLGGQRAVAAGLHLHRRHQGGQLGADDRLRPGAAAARGADADPRRSARRPACASGRSR